jgi:hypothetical protein
MGWETCPLAHVFTNCADLIRTLPALPYRETGNVEDANTAGEDHLPDAFRYLLMELGGGQGAAFSEYWKAQAARHDPDVPEACEHFYDIDRLCAKCRTPAPD